MTISSLSGLRQHPRNHVNSQACPHVLVAPMGITILETEVFQELMGCQSHSVSRKKKKTCFKRVRWTMLDKYTQSHLFAYIPKYIYTSNTKRTQNIFFFQFLVLPQHPNMWTHRLRGSSFWLLFQLYRGKQISGHNWGDSPP